MNRKGLCRQLAAGRSVAVPAFGVGTEQLVRVAGGWSNVAVLFDVGANDGADSLPFAAAHPDTTFVAVEPTPELAEGLRSAAKGLANYHVVESAVGLDTGTVGFNVIPGYAGGLNSRFRANDFLMENWAQGDSIRTIQVPVAPLEAIARRLGIDRIDVLHVDTQGADLDVLRSAGPLLDTVSVGVIEVTRTDRRLYDGTPDPRVACAYLRDRGFSPAGLHLNDVHGAEVNLVFERTSRSVARAKWALLPVLALSALVVPRLIGLVNGLLGALGRKQGPGA